MKQIFFLASAFALLAAASCGSKSGEAQSDVPAVSKPVNTNEQPQVTTPANNSVVPTAPAVNTSQPVSVINTTPVNITSQPTTATNTAGLNPAHGQPGHRCDIPVGTPLNSAPAAQPTVTTNTSPGNLKPSIVNTAPTIISTAPTNTVAPGMNPAHGQPGHRCDIPVGSPLNSAPATAKPTITTTPVAPAKKDN